MSPEPRVLVERHDDVVIASVRIGTRVLRSIGYDESEMARWVKAWALSAIVVHVDRRGRK